MPIPEIHTPKNPNDHGSWSLSAHIVAGVTAAVLGSLLVLALALAAFTRFEVTERLDDSLREVAERLVYIVAFTPARQGGPQIAILPGIGPRALAYQVTDAAGRVILRSQNAPEEPLVTPTVPGFYDRPHFRVFVSLSSDKQHGVLVAEPSFHRLEAVHRAIVIATLPILVLAPVVWLLVRWIVRRGLRPVDALGAELRRRGGGYLDPVSAPDLPVELTAIQNAVNLLLHRLDKALSAERAFAANAAHELRNPIGAILAQAQLLQTLHASRMEPEGAHRTIADATPGIETLIAQVRRLGGITDKLLQLSRAWSGVALRRDRFDVIDLVAFVSEELERRDGRADNRAAARIRFQPGASRRMMVEGDLDAAGLLFRNLIENALSYGQPPADGGPTVIIMLAASNVVEIINDCTALAPDLLAGIETPFVRGRHESPGSGLGLAIATTIATQMNARLDLISPIPGTTRGFLARITFPDLQATSALSTPARTMSASARRH